MSCLIGVEEVMEILNVSQSMAYKLIREVNRELGEKGYLTINAKVNKTYLLERFGIEN